MPRLGVIFSHKWATGRTLTVCFLDGSASLQNKVKTYGYQWMQFANIKFNFIAGRSADIRITFTGAGGVSSSTLGTYTLEVKGSPMMKLGFDDRTEDQKIERITLHEFGHALGCVHEHQQPNFNFNGPLLRLIEEYGTKAQLGFCLRPLSITLHPIPARWTYGKFSLSLNANLSDPDKAWISAMYPFPTSPASMPIIWGNGQPLVVTTRGAGSLHLLTYNNNQVGLNTNCIGAVPTTNTGVTRFLVSFTHSYLAYAFFWDGPGEAVYAIGTGSRGQSVGKSWTQASAITPCYIIPDKT